MRVRSLVLGFTPVSVFQWLLGLLVGVKYGLAAVVARSTATSLVFLVCFEPATAIYVESVGEKFAPCCQSFRLVVVDVDAVDVVTAAVVIVVVVDFR